MDKLIKLFKGSYHDFKLWQILGQECCQRQVLKDHVHEFDRPPKKMEGSRSFGKGNIHLQAIAS